MHLPPGNLDLQVVVDHTQGDLVSSDNGPREAYAAPDGFTIDVAETATSPLTASEDPSWVGTGTVGGITTTLTSTNSDAPSGGNHHLGTETFVSGTFCVQYFYLAPEPEVVSIGDYVWWDHDRDGLQGSEPVAGGTTVNLLDPTTLAVVRSTTTDPGGYYYFADLPPSTPYVVEFVKPSGPAISFTDQNTGDDARDSDADRTTGRVSIITPASGENRTGPGLADDPTIDAGLVQFNLVIAKALATAGPFSTGQSVSFTLTPTNQGPSTALGGWSVTDVLPSGLTATGITGSGYTCVLATLTCTSATPLVSQQSGSPITVTATIDATASGRLHNVAYVSPSPSDVPETNPLVIPTTGTETGTTPTDNDAEAELVLTPGPTAPPETPSEPPTTPAPTPPSEPSPTPTPTPTPTVQQPSPLNPPSAPAPSNPARLTPRLPETGAGNASAMLGGAVLLVGAGLALRLRRRTDPS